MERTIAEMFKDQGAIKKEREILLRLLRKRFKKVPRDVAARIAAETEFRALDRWIEKTIDADNLEEVGIK